MRLREIASTIQITERATQRIVADLISAGYVDRTRTGRRNSYTVRTDLPVLLPSQRDVELSALLSVLLPNASSEERREVMEASHPLSDGATATVRPQSPSQTEARSAPPAHQAS